MFAWRICKEQYAASALSGEGARLFAGRWNPAGVRMVYCSTSLALAALEVFVHLDPSVAPDDLIAIRLQVPDESVETIESFNLPPDWRSDENLAARTLGADWARSQSSLALLVPSVVIEGEWNLLLNPAHPDFLQVEVASSSPFHFDARMFSR